MSASSEPTTIPPHERAANEFWIYAIRYKGLVLIVVVVTNILALFPYSLADPVYENRVGIVVGRAYIDGKIQGIEKGKDILRRFQVEYEITGHSDANLKVYKPIKIMDRGRALIFFVVQGSDRQVMKTFTSEPLENLISEHGLIIAAGQKALKVAVQETQIQLDAINLQTESFVDKRRVLPGEDSRSKDKPEKYGEQLLAHKVMLESRLNKLKSNNLRHEPTRLLWNPAASVPVSPKLTLYLFLASVVGIILGLCGAVVQGRRNE